MSAFINRLTLSRAAVYFSRCLAAIVAVGITTMVLLLAANWVNTAVAVLVYLLPVGLAALIWGSVPGLSAAVAAVVALDYFFILPARSLDITRADDWVLALAFIGVVLAGTPMLGRARASLLESRARQRALMHLYELITALSGLRREDAIARTVSVRLQAALQARLVEVVFQIDADHDLVSSRTPENAAVPAARPDYVVPLMTPRGLLGEIHIWTQGAPLPPYTEQLLHTSAGQAALAFERVVLAEAETRAQVLEESDRMKSVLLSSVSHELRTPLATIKAAISSLRSGAVQWDSPARVELLAAVEEEADQLNLLVGNLLDMSRIEAGALSLQRQWNVLADIVDSTLDRLRRAAERHRVHVDVSEELPLVLVDYAQMEQVFANLISNSLKYAPPGTAVGICARPRNGALEVTVANQSPPVAEEHLERIFDKFHRVTAADRITGTGLGLSICKGIVEAHGGRLWAENLADGSAAACCAEDDYTFAFHFTLPLVQNGGRLPESPAEIDPHAEPAGMPGP